MHFKKSMLSGIVTLAITATPYVVAQEVTGNTNLAKETGAASVSKSKSKTFIIQLKGQSAIEHAQEIGELLPSNQMVSTAGNQYNAMTPAMKAYTAAMEKKQNAVAGDIGSLNIIHSFKHTFNGFTAVLNDKQKAQLESHPDVVGVWEDKVEYVNTANTPAFLGLTGPGGQHTLGIKGEDVVIGVMDTGIWPENPSFADDGSYSDPASIGWQGVCDKGEDPTFSCNNKLIGARYYKDSFESSYKIQTELGESISPRDADGHGSHTASTAGGNAGVTASVNGVVQGVVSGMAPRARIAMYKTCWNSDYVSPEGVKERGCFYGDNMAAIDQAVVDGVDVINFSIGGSLTDLTTPPAAAMLRASQAGVFVAVSAGNSGPDAETVGTPAPWVTNVAASTYSGSVPSQAIRISSREPSELVIAIEGSITKPLSESGPVSQSVVVAEPLLACFEGGDSGVATPLTNADEINGKIALISRGTCAFDQKVARAQMSGATAVVVYSDDRPPTSMGGEMSFDIPGVMIAKADGQALNASITGGENVVVDLAADIFTTQEVTGNTMADFSSRGPNKASYDIIKPDITAPGVKILAATTSAPMFGAQGETYAYLQGTSMAAPHVAGLAALFKESNSSWTPAQIKSALMTTARQNLTKEDGLTQADPFDFGSGHASPVNAMDPGLLFNTDQNDYLAFLCGNGKESFVASTGVSCDALVNAGFSTDASQLNLPSIGIAELGPEETIFRTVSNATAVASVYSATVEAPAGINVSVKTFDKDGNEVEDGTLPVDANGSASFAVTFSKNESANFDWEFGAITWTDNQGHSVRLPIAIKAVPDVKIEVPETISGQMSRGMYRFPVKMLYTGATGIDYAGLVAPFGSSRTVSQDPDQEFSFNEAGMGTHIFLLPEGTKVARFSLRDSLIGDGSGGTDLDMYVYRCDKWLCTRVAQSLNGGSTEDVILTNPEPRADYGVGDVYIVWVHGYDLAGAETADYTMPVWVAAGKESTTRVISSTRAINGRYNYVTVYDRSLTPGTIYMGGITFTNDEGKEEGTTILELQAN